MNINIMLDYYKRAARQGPGSEYTTKLALSFIDNIGKTFNVLDVGCGTGKQTTHLAKNLRGKITAMDFHKCLLDEFNYRLATEKLCTEIKLIQGSMTNIPFDDNEFDLIWSEGAIYIMGFSKGLKEWRRLLKKEGYLAVTEISWLTDTRPAELENFWNNRYEEMETISDKLKLIEETGYSPTAHFILPDDCWMENYYFPLVNNNEAFLKKHNYSEDAKAVIAEVEKEMELYKKYMAFYGYVFYIMKKV